jgi:hypothetical protein
MHLRKLSPTHTKLFKTNVSKTGVIGMLPTSTFSLSFKISFFILSNSKFYSTEILALLQFFHQKHQIQ